MNLEGRTVTVKLELYSVDTIADWFLAKSSMTQKKLQKLVYYTQGWSNALLKQPIIDTDFEAWIHGPVSRKLYSKYNEQGWLDISKLDRAPVIDNSKVEDLLESVWLTYSDLDEDSLEALTSTEEPWKETRIDCKVNETSHKIISNQTMGEFYRSIQIEG